VFPVDLPEIERADLSLRAAVVDFGQGPRGKGRGQEASEISELE